MLLTITVIAINQYGSGYTYTIIYNIMVQAIVTYHHGPSYIILYTIMAI